MSKVTTLITILLISIMTLMTWLIIYQEKNNINATQPTEVKVIDLPEEFDLVTDDTLMCYKRNDTLFIRFNKQQDYVEEENRTYNYCTNSDASTRVKNYLYTYFPDWKIKKGIKTTQLNTCRFAVSLRIDDPNNIEQLIVFEVSYDSKEETFEVKLIRGYLY